MNRSSIPIFFMICVLLLGAAGCASGQSEAPAEAGVVLAGLRQGDITLTADGLHADYDPVLMQCRTDPDGEILLSVLAEGVKLEAVLNTHGASQLQFDAVIFSSEERKVTVPDEILHEREILIAWAVDGAAQSPGIVIPDTDAGYWISDLVRIELVTDDETSEPVMLPGGRV